MEADHQLNNKVNNVNNDLHTNSSKSYEFVMAGNQSQTENPSFDQSTFSEESNQAQIKYSANDDDQIHQFGYDLEVKIPKNVLDEIFYSYFLKQRSFGLIWFLISSIHFDAYCVWLQYTNPWREFSLAIILLSLNFSMIITLLYSRYKKSRYQQIIWKVSPYMAWLISVAQIGTFIDSGKVNPLEVLGWGIFINFQIYITFPIPLLWEGVALGLLNGVIFTTFNVVMCNEIDYKYKVRAILTNMTMGVTAAIIGIVHSILNELKQRIAFLEAKKSLEVNMKIEEHSQVQERLLLSVLPKYVADKVRMDMGVTKSDQFKKIYMSRHENVSILYADIVGFTAISSTYSAQDLVKMLNELFARFDRLADKYEQLRIKILGDCYYCISGAPDEKIDHAILSCHMGLSMVHAIKYLQHKTNSPVDMRVGIHTGAILAGILGQRQWQFDVYSKDVELANKMESSGMAGRVHISEKTRLCLRDQFAVEPAYGEKREPALRLAGLTTYFISKVLVPFQDRNKVELQDHLTIKMQSQNEDFKDMIDDDSLSSLENVNPQLDQDSRVEEFIERFKNELNELTQDELHFRQLFEKTNMFLTFVNKGVEKAYHKNREKISSLTLLPIALINIVDSICSFFIFSDSRGHILQIGPSMLIIIVTIIFMAESCGILSSCLRSMSKRVNDNEWLRHGIALAVIIVTISTFLLEMIYYYREIKENGSQDDNIEILSFQSFYTNLGILLLMSVAVISHLTHIVKIGIMVGYLSIHSVLLFTVVRFKDEAALTEDEISSAESFNLNMIILLSAVTLVLCYLSRYMDRDDRVIFMWKTEVGEQRKKYADMRKKNQTLVYNVLPVNVAEHFMKNIKRSHLYLYSQSYSEVGVLFASMPNFSDFYSEETVNNQGLECLRVLNEVISDYDALLDLPRFKEITKIKTIGSTYMAASGLNILQEFNQTDSIVIRWSHLDILVQFASELTQALQDINEQSFNNFVLKMGINHGPITAGVIGASKPHYDIWGNTVNVASRMESTGQAGAIQVTKETAQILSSFGYAFKQRGYVNVKGKGELLTFYLQGKENPPDHTSIIPITSSPTTTTPMKKNITLNNKTIKDISLLDIGPSAELKLSGSPTNRNTMNGNGPEINEIVDLRTNLISLNNPPRSSSILETQALSSRLNENYGTNDSKNEGVSKEEDQKSAEIEVDVRTPLLSSSNIGDSGENRM